MTMRQLTRRQKQVLDCIVRHVREYGMPPTRSEIADEVGLKDASTITGHLERLADAGWIQLLPKKKRGIRVVEMDLPLVGPIGEIAAGTPILAEGHIVERIPAAVAERFRPRPDYFLTVRGDSMDRTGLRDGDVVAVRATNEASNRDVVVARFRGRGDLEALLQDRQASHRAAPGEQRSTARDPPDRPREAHPPHRRRRGGRAHREPEQRLPLRPRGAGGGRAGVVSATGERGTEARTPDGTTVGSRGKARQRRVPRLRD